MFILCCADCGTYNIDSYNLTDRDMYCCECQTWVPMYFDEKDEADCAF